MQSNQETKTALVTGSTSGIGRAVARALAADGVHVVVTGRDADRGKKTVAEIERAGGRATLVVADLGEPADVTTLAAAATEIAGGALDTLVNNAALLIGPTVTAESTVDSVDRALAVSVRAPYLLTGALAPAMAARGRGAVVNIGSINGVLGMTGAALYGATKAALHSMTKSWAFEYGPHGVRVNTVAPGPTLTEGNEAHAELLEGLVANIPSRRLSTMDEVADAVVFLAGDRASHVHGSTLFVDGGFTAGRDL